MGRDFCAQSLLLAQKQADPGADLAEILPLEFDQFRVSTCKNRDCYENNVVLLYSGAQDGVYGKVYQHGKSTLIGSAPPAVAAEL
jgi:hypothetical protein